MILTQSTIKEVKEVTTAGDQVELLLSMKESRIPVHPLHTRTRDTGQWSPLETGGSRRNQEVWTCPAGTTLEHSENILSHLPVLTTHSSNLSGENKKIFQRKSDACKATKILVIDALTCKV